MSWLIEESGNPEDGYSWNLFECQDGRLTMRATLYDEKFGLKMKGAMDWLDSLEAFHLDIRSNEPTKPAAKVSPKRKPAASHPASTRRKAK